MITYNYKINMTPGGPPMSVPVNQYDENFTLIFQLVSAVGEMEIESGTTAAIRGTKSDGNVYSAEAEIEENTITVEGDKQMTAAPGRNVFELTLYKDGKELNTANFILDVERAAMQPGGTQSDSQVYELADVIMRAQDIIDAAYGITEVAAETQEYAETAADAAAHAGNNVAAAREAQNNASQYAINASESASNASRSATAAQEAEEAAAEAATSAEGSAEEVTKALKSLYLDDEGYLCQREVEV